jgi:hypothetical protein
MLGDLTDMSEGARAMAHAAAAIYALGGRSEPCEIQGMRGRDLHDSFIRCEAALLAALMLMLASPATGCNRSTAAAPRPGAGTGAPAGQGGTVPATTPAAAPAPVAPAPVLREVEPPHAQPGLDGDSVVAARLFAFGDSQLRYQYGKRSFAQSPFAERMSFEVAVRPAALDDGSDLLLALFLDEHRARYAGHTLVFLGDAADLSCEQEMDAFTASLSRAGVARLLAVTSNHDGFYAGNFTSRSDVDGDLRVTDMPHDWTRACSEPGRFADRRLTKGRAVKRFHALLPPGPDWATEARFDRDGPTQFRDSYLYYLRQLGGGDPGAPPVWGVFLDTVDYRGFAFERSRGAGSVGAVSREQLRFLDRAMFEARIAAGAAPVTFVVFGHHPYRTLEPQSRARLASFLDAHPEIAAYVSAHAHQSMERSIALPGGRALPELIVGSTTDAPQSARLIEIQVGEAQAGKAGAGKAGAGKAGAGVRRAALTRRLVLDADALCADIAPLPADAIGYTGYRIVRDSTPDLDIGALEKIMFALSVDDLASQRTVQALGAMIMENDLVRAFARLYADAPIRRSAPDQAMLEGILARRYAAGNDVASLRPYLRGDARPREATSYSAWHDPVMSRVLAVAEHGLHRFGAHAALFQRLRALRTSDPDVRRYFACHAIHAAEAESRSLRTRGDVLYIR